MWPFRDKPEPSAPEDEPMPPLNEDWKVGDLALSAVPTESWIVAHNTDVPTEGSTYRVTAIRTGIQYKVNKPNWFLYLAGMNSGYTAFAFRKVRQDEEECTTEFAETIKNLKPARVK